jgi:transposase
MMEITRDQYEKIKDAAPVQRGNVRIDNLTFLNAIFYIVENGCKWRKLPKSFGPWSTIYMRMRRWADNEV